MINNPYRVLGVPDGAGEEECTKAYKRLAKKYHPDLNPNDKEAERKMAEINAAYDLIKSGNANQSHNAYSYDYSEYRRQSSSSPDYLDSAAQFINTGQYRQAINLLNNIEDRNARWHYLYALANMATGNIAAAQDHIRSAYAKEPDNITYRQAYSDIMNGTNPLNKDPFSSFFDFGEYSQSTTYTNQNQSANRGYTGRTYTVGRGGCLGRIIRIILIIIAIRIALSFIASIFYRATYRYPSPTSSYSQEYDNSHNAGDYFGDENNRQEHNL